MDAATQRILSSLPSDTKRPLQISWNQAVGWNCASFFAVTAVRHWHRKMPLAFKTTS
jgi:hypothetical protein